MGDGEELLRVDQHTAHERVRFERLRDRAGRHAVESQGLVSPLVIELSPLRVPREELSRWFGRTGWRRQ